MHPMAEPIQHRDWPARLQVCYSCQRQRTCTCAARYGREVICLTERLEWTSVQSFARRVLPTFFEAEQLAANNCKARRSPCAAQGLCAWNKHGSMVTPAMALQESSESA